jgi:HEAT repeat protein
MNMTREEEDNLVTADLNRLGMDVTSVFDLMKWKQPYPEAVPVLLEHLPRVQDKWIKEGIVRALTAKEARGKADGALVAEFRAAAPSQTANIALKWAIGNALSVVATDGVFADVIELLKDKQHGQSREMLAVALGNMKNPTAVDVLIELLNDDEVAGHALIGLAKLKAQKSRPHIERFLNHPKPWVRKKASKALAKLNK